MVPVLPYNPGMAHLGPQAQQMAKNCKDERMAVAFQWIAITSMAVLAGTSAYRLLREIAKHEKEQHPEGRSR